MFDLSIVTENIGLYLEGLQTTVQLVSVALVIGLVMAVPLAVMRTSRNPLINGPVWAYTYFFRGTPLLVQMFMIYYGLGQLEAWQALSQDWPFLRDAYWYALLAFTLNTAAYTTEIIRGGILGTPHGEIEAARACGMNPPSTMRRILPAYSNEVIFMLHGSAIASVITIIDLTGAARVVNSRFYSPYEAFITVALFYMALTFTIVWGFRVLERRISGHLRERSEMPATVPAAGD